jgi:hypothetical protein
VGQVPDLPSANATACGSTDCPDVDTNVDAARLEARAPQSNSLIVFGDG